MKIQINSLEALERLIGGDSELEFDIRQSVAEAFTKKHLKSLATAELIEKARIAISKELTNEFFVIKDSMPIKLNYKYQQQLQEGLDSFLNKQVEALLSNAIEQNASLIKLKILIDEQVLRIGRMWSTEAITQRINSEVDKKIKDKLGIK